MRLLQKTKINYVVKINKLYLRLCEALDRVWYEKPTRKNYMDDEFDEFGDLLSWSSYVT